MEKAITIKRRTESLVDFLEHYFLSEEKHELEFYWKGNWKQIKVSSFTSREDEKATCCCIQFDYEEVPSDFLVESVELVENLLFRDKTEKEYFEAYRVNVEACKRFARECAKAFEEN
tara:strand:+ start:958 stop:1308 length:351 start_codon:yes stop_codon:yes gene_type:complete